MEYNMKVQFLIEMEVSSNDINLVQTKLEQKLSNWLDDISFITGKEEKLLSIKSLNIEEEETKLVKFE